MPGVRFPRAIAIGAICLETSIKVAGNGIVGLMAGDIARTNVYLFAKVLAISSLAQNVLILLTEFIFERDQELGSAARLFLHLTSHTITGFVLFRLGLINYPGLIVYTALSFLCIRLNPTGQYFLIKFIGGDPNDFSSNLKSLIGAIRSLIQPILKFAG